MGRAEASIASLTLLVVLSGCASDELVVLPSGDARFALVIETEGAVSRGAFASLDQPYRRSVPEGAELLVLSYSSKPLGLEPGEVSFVPGGRAIPVADAYHRLEGASFTRLESPPERVRVLNLPRGDVCLDFDVRAADFPDHPTFFVAIDARRTFAGTLDRRFFILNEEETIELTELSSTTPSRAAFVRGDEVFLAGPDHRFAVGHPDRGFVAGPELAAPVGGDVIMVGAPPGEPLELFLTDSTAAVQRFDGRAWTLIRRGHDPIDQNRASLAWSSPGKVALTGGRASAVLEIDASGQERAFELELARFPRVDGLRTLGRVEGAGLLAGSLIGALFEREGDVWERRPAAQDSVSIDEILDLGEGRFIAGGNGGVFVQWGPGKNDVCPTIAGLGVENDRGIARIGAGFIALTGRLDVGFTRYTAMPR